jgi:predicted enzyme related to lactoylglutathione lyase
MQVFYLEVVTPDVSGVCGAYEAAHGVRFGEPDPRLGNARLVETAKGGMLGVRAPLQAAEEPAVRPYWLVDDIEAAYAAALGAGAEEVHPPLEIPGLGTFAIYGRGGDHHGLWQR